MEHEDRYERCLKCRYHSIYGCSLMGDALETHIEKCILDYDAIKAITSGSLDEYIFFRNPLEYLSWLGYKDKENYPKPGQMVLTLNMLQKNQSGGKNYLNLRNERGMIYAYCSRVVV